MAVRSRPGAPRGLVVFDLDGTLLRHKTACELLADGLGQSARMREMERLRTQPEILGAREEMARWYEGVPLTQLLSCLEAAELAPRTTEAMSLLRDHDIECAISSVTWLFAVRWFAERFDITHYQGTSISDDGEIGHVWPRDKGTWVRELAALLRVPADRVASVGDSWRDVEMFKASAKAYFVGSAVTADLPDSVTRVEDHNLLSVAQSLVEAWR